MSNEQQDNRTFFEKYKWAIQVGAVLGVVATGVLGICNQVDVFQSAEVLPYLAIASALTAAFAISIPDTR